MTSEASLIEHLNRSINKLKKSIFVLEGEGGISVNRWTNIDRPERVVEALVGAANLGYEVPLRWIRRLYKYGVTDSLLTELERLVRDIRMNVYLELNPSSKKFEWKGNLDADSGLGGEPIFALCVVWLVNAGAVEGLKRCALEDCRKYFIGGPRAKWCSENCGSKHRVRKKRRLDKQR